jgi:isoamylase
MHVDGFRFDEGSILARDQSGVLVPYPPVVWAIELSDILADTKIVAEVWDAAGAYQIGYFPGYRWAEWNGRYRDDIRRFVKGDPGLVGAVASRIAGSADIYQGSGHLPINSINFVTCHDGFTLNDLVSYNAKHNEANGEGNRDGADNNLSWNCGVEGPTDNLEVEGLRRRQIKNFIAILMLSQGVPMICGGDEVRRSQRGNNNPYCQDNEISWFDWSLVDKDREIFRFCQRMIDFRKRNRALRRSEFFTGETNARGLIDIAWHACRLSSPGWSDPNSRALAFTLAGREQDQDIHVMMNMYWESLDFELPPLSGRAWSRAVDTALLPPDDISDPGAEVSISGNSHLVTPRSVVVLVSK